MRRHRDTRRNVLAGRHQLAEGHNQCSSHPGFDIDEEYLVIGTKVMANVLLAYLDYHQ